MSTDLIEMRVQTPSTDVNQRASDGTQGQVTQSPATLASDDPDCTEARAYGATVAGVLAESPFVAPLDTIVQWCRARRAVRASAITADGKVEASTGAKVPFQLRLEDADGKAAEATR